MKVGLGLLLASSIPSAGGNANISDPYQLPPSMVYIEACQQEALHLHPGVIDKQRVINRHGDFWVRYEILMRSGVEWSVICDLANGKIIREQNLVDGSF